MNQKEEKNSACMIVKMTQQRTFPRRVDPTYRKMRDSSSIYKLYFFPCPAEIMNAFKHLNTFAMQPYTMQ